MCNPTLFTDYQDYGADVYTVANGYGYEPKPRTSPVNYSSDKIDKIIVAVRNAFIAVFALGALAGIGYLGYMMVDKWHCFNNSGMSSDEIVKMVLVLGIFLGGTTAVMSAGRRNY